MPSDLTRFWIEFDFEDMNPPDPLLTWGCGVTGAELSDCLDLIQERLLEGRALPPIRRVTEDVDVRQLDQRHVIPNMGPPIWRGVWFPQGPYLGAFQDPH